MHIQIAFPIVLLIITMIASTIRMAKAKRKMRRIRDEMTLRVSSDCLPIARLPCNSVPGYHQTVHQCTSVPIFPPYLTICP